MSQEFQSLAFLKRTIGIKSGPISVGKKGPDSSMAVCSAQSQFCKEVPSRIVIDCYEFEN